MAVEDIYNVASMQRNRSTGKKTVDSEKKRAEKNEQKNTALLYDFSNRTHMIRISTHVRVACKRVDQARNTGKPAKQP